MKSKVKIYKRIHLALYLRETPEMEVEAIKYDGSNKLLLYEFLKDYEIIKNNGGDQFIINIQSDPNIHVGANHTVNVNCYVVKCPIRGILIFRPDDFHCKYREV